MWTRGPQIAALLVLFAACNAEEADTGPGQDPGDNNVGGNYGGVSDSDAPLVVTEGGEDGGGDPGSEDLTAMCPGWTAGSSVHGLAHPAGNTLASATYVRDMLSHGLAPNPARVRAQDVVNYYDAPYAAEGAIELFVDIMPTELQNAAPTRYTMQIALAAPPVTLQPLSLTLVLDGSGSMGGEAEARQAAAVEAISSQLRKGDRVRIFTFADDVVETLPLHEVSGPGDDALIQALPSEPDGKSNVTPALQLAFESATIDANDDRGFFLHRVVLMTDGAASVTGADGTDVRSLVRSADAQGVFVTAVSTGPTVGYDDSLLLAVSQDGRGTTLYLDDQPGGELGDVFRERFEELMGIGARDVSFEVTLPPGASLVVPADVASTQGGTVRTAHLAPGDALVMQHEIELCSADVAAYLDDIVVRAKWVTPTTLDAAAAKVVVSIPTLPDLGAMARVSKISALLAYAGALRGPVVGRLQAAATELEMALEQSPGDQDLEEALALLQSHPALTVAE